MSLESEFTQAMHGAYESARKRGYVAIYFLQMLHEYGGVETARRLLATSEPQTGLYTLWELGLLHDSMEALVLQEKFRPLFGEAEIAEARLVSVPLVDGFWGRSNRPRIGNE